MKALILKEINSPLVFDETPAPGPAKGQVGIRLRAASLNRRDYWITQGLYPGIKCPVILGSDGVGTVSSLGPGVDTSWAGKEVIINPGCFWGDLQTAQSPDFKILGLPDNGTFAEQIVVPVEQIHEKPEHLESRKPFLLAPPKVSTTPTRIGSPDFAPHMARQSLSLTEQAAPAMPP